MGKTEKPGQAFRFFGSDVKPDMESALLAARLGRAVTLVVIGIAEPQFRVGCAGVSHLGLLVHVETYTEAYTQSRGLRKRNVTEAYIRREGVPPV